MCLKIRCDGYCVNFFFGTKRSLTGVGRLGGQVAVCTVPRRTRGLGAGAPICGPHTDHAGARWAVAALPRRHLCVLGDKADDLVSSVLASTPAAPYAGVPPPAPSPTPRRRPPSCHQITAAPRSVLST